VGPDLQAVRLAADVRGSVWLDRQSPTRLGSASRSRWGLRVPAASHFLLDGLRSSDGDAPPMLEQDRKQAGWSVGRAAWRLGVGIREYWDPEGLLRQGPGSRRTGGDRWSDGEAEDQRHHEDECRHPDENGALSCFGSERVQGVSFTFHFSCTFHCIRDTPRGDVGI
jgi:hypothetical protein